MSDYRLGDRVLIHAVMAKSRDRVTWRPQQPHRIYSEVIANWPEIKDMQGLARFGLLRTRLVKSRKPVGVDQGVIVGKRNVQQGITEHYSDGDVPCFMPGESTPVYLVAFHLSRKPAMCTADQIERIKP